jgi:hypothetical protein
MPEYCAFRRYRLFAQGVLHDLGGGSCECDAGWHSSGCRGRPQERK